MLEFVVYTLFYWISHIYIAYRIRYHNYINKDSKSFRFSIIFYRIWLYILDTLTLKTIYFENNLYQFNSYPIILSFSLLFYFICRHCLRNQYCYQYIVHIYHPQTTILYFGHYYLGFYYSIADFLLKYAIIQYLLNIQIVLGMLFLFSLSVLDTWFYYNNITDSTGEMFQKVVGYLFYFINEKKD
jgi:hypothetical protein